MRYIPVLNGRQAEYRALQNLPAELQDKILPLIQVTSIPWDYEEEKPSCDIDEHLEKNAEKIIASWPEKSLILNLEDSLLGETTSTGESAISYLSQQLKAAKVTLIPLIDFRKPAEYLIDVEKILKQDRSGACLRLTPEDFSTQNISDAIEGLLKKVSIEIDAVDLILDFGAILPGQDSTTLLALEQIIDLLPSADKWRTITFIGSSFPKDLSDFEGNTIDKTPRVEWAIWNQLQSNSKKEIHKKIGYGDYTISHPEQVSMNPKLMTISASFRYTCEDCWLVIRGRSTKKYGFGQYNELCNALVVRKEYCGPKFSKADEIISECAASKVGEKTGNYTTWRLVGVLHHITFVIKQLGG